MRTVSLNSFNITEQFVEVKTFKESAFVTSTDETSLEVDLTNTRLMTKGLPIYFGFLEFFGGQNNHLSAYGGYLTYTLHYSSVVYGKAEIKPDVILIGRNMTFIHQSYEQPANELDFHGSIHFIESSFTTPGGIPVTREQFMVLLRDLDQIYIRANYWENTDRTKISDVLLTIADEDVDNYDNYQDLAVEKCYCPPGYTGLSCEDCAPGYYRDPNGPHGGFCIPCQCNGHADTCDCETGICNVS